MKNLLVTGAWLLLGFAASASTETQKTTVHFASDSYVLDAKASETLTDFLNEIRLTGDYEFQIDGHTDQEGNNRYNNTLSQQRAEAVKSFFEKSGIETATLFTEAHGKKQLLFKRHDAASMHQNRRVDIVFKRFYFENVDELMAELAQSTQNSFQIESDKANTLTCGSGSRIFIPENGFVDSLGNDYHGVVNIEVIEALNFHDFLANGLATISDGELLESGGMLNVEAFAENGMPLNLTDSSTLSIAFPVGNRSAVDGMFLFLSSNGTNWTTTTSPAVNRWNLDIPDKPAPEVPDVDFPEYTFDASGKPHLPVMPVYPSYPAEPRPESYYRPTKWYEFFSRKRIKESCQLRYDVAMLNFETKVTRYHKRVESYRRDSVLFPEWMGKYKIDLAQWMTEKNRSLDDFTNNEWKDALRFYQRLSKVEQQKYAARFAVWDSIRLAKRSAYNTMLANLGFPEGANPYYYLFNQTKLEWLNCDKFQKLPESEKFQLVACIPESSPEERVMAILTRYNSLVPLDRSTDTHYISTKLPFKEEVLIVAYKIEEGGIQVARSLTSKQYSVKLEYKPIKLGEFRAFLKELGS